MSVVYRGSHRRTELGVSLRSSSASVSARLNWAAAYRSDSVLTAISRTARRRAEVQRSSVSAELAVVVGEVGMFSTMLLAPPGCDRNAYQRCG